MAKETVRYPDALVARIEAFVDDSVAFESKSEYHRFASEFLLSLLDPDHEPSVLGYGEIFEDLGTELDDALDDGSDGEERFLETYIRVRRHLLHGELDAARAVVDETYDVTDREALLLDELIGQSRASRPESAAAGGPSPGRVGAGPTVSTNGRGPETETTETADTDASRVDGRTDAGAGTGQADGKTDRDGRRADERGDAEDLPVDETPIESEH
ncbi:hypothetical protein [Salinigranum salinum]|uniref:hypothetical protein n=1 Tax=Salinigranum salinum TaxID=1364937 RepID=UPI001864A34C|nr:hypothetical protein [Salinigranum salinum]